MEPSEESKSGEVIRIGKYEVIEVLGRGGMGVVYRAVDKHLGREVAIKTLTQAVMGDPGMLSRFYEEGRKTGRLKHPNIVTVYDLGDDNGTPYIVMECVEGDPLDKILRSDEPLSMIDSLRIVEEVCSALGYAHRNNVVHRDVKPANIFVQPDGRAKLLDFGIARLENRGQDLSLTRAGHIIGTIPYMAPERLKDKAIDGRSDIFSAGVVLYQLVAGQLPFTGEDYVLMQKIMNEPHPPLSTFRRNCPAGLETIIDRALAKLEDERYQTAEEMASDLSTVIGDLRQEQVIELLPEAQRLVDAQELVRARTVLLQLLKIQSKHPEARELLVEIQRRLAVRQREERLQQIRQQAEEAFANLEFDQSLSILKDGLELDAANAELLKLQDRVRREKVKQERIDDLLRVAESARRKGDYKAAIAAAQKALKVDKANSKAVAVFSSLAREAEQAQREAQAKALLETARGQLDSRRYVEALETLRKAEELDPASPEVQLLLGDANSGLEQQRRRELIARLEQDVSRASSRDELTLCAQSIQEAIASMPAESALFRLNALVDRRIKEYVNREFVDDTLMACRDLRPREAMEAVRQARQRLPGDERLLSLEALLTERLNQQTVSERREEYIARAREALTSALYSDAVHVLEACQAEGIATDEVSALLDFARSEESEQRRQNRLRDALDRAQNLIDEGDYEAAISFLEQAVGENQDHSLRLLREQASAARDSQKRQIEAGMAAAGSLVHAGKFEDAVELLEALPLEVLKSARIRMAIAALQDEVRQPIYRTVGRAYALVDSETGGAERMMRRVAAATDGTSSLASAPHAFQLRARAVADRTILDAIVRCEQSLRSRDRVAAEEIVRRAGSMAEKATPAIQADWQNLLNRMNRKTLLGRLKS